MLLCSICFSNPNRPLRIYLLHSQLPGDKLKKLKDSLLHHDLSINFIEVADKPLAELELPLFHGSYAPYFKVMIADLLPVSEKKVLYLDCDTLVLDSLDEIFDTPLGDSYLGAVADQHRSYRFRDAELTRALFKSSELSQKSFAFNSGVLLINLEKWRKDRFSKTVLDYCHHNRTLIQLPDQDALNVCVGEQWLRLPERWNVQTPTFYRQGKSTLGVSQSDYLEIIRNPGIVHFTGEASRPWNRVGDHPYRKLFEYFFMKSEWRNSGFIQALRGLDWLHLFRKHLKSCIAMRPWFGRNWSGAWLDKKKEFQ